MKTNNLARTNSHKTKTMKRASLRTCCALATILLAGAAQAQIPVTDSPATQPPIPGYYDQYYLPGAVVEGLDTIGSAYTNNGYAGIMGDPPYSGNNDGFTYVSEPDRTSKAQSFTTGSSSLGYTLKSFTFQQVQGTNGAGGSGTGWINNGTYFLLNNGDSLNVRVGSLSGGPFSTSYTTILETNATYNGTTHNTGGQTSALGVYFNFDFSGAGLTLSPNTTYFVEVMATSGDHFELNNTDTNPVSKTFPPVYMNGQALVGNTTAGLDATGAFSITTTNGGVFAFDAGLAAVGAPTVVATAKPSTAAAGLPFKLTAIVTPGIGTVTNVSVNLSSIGGPAAAQLVLSNANVYTNTFTVDANAPLGTTNLMVTATQDTRPDIIGVGFTPFTAVSANAPVIAQDTTPSAGYSFYVGQGVTWFASFTGPQPISLNWQYAPDGYTFTNIPGATNNLYVIPSAQLSDEGFYQLVASNAFGATLSTPVGMFSLEGTPKYLFSAPIPFAGLNAEQILTNFPSTNKIAGAMVAQNGGNGITVTLTNAGNQQIVFAGMGAWATVTGGNGWTTGANTNATGNTSFNNVLNAKYYDSQAAPNNFQTVTFNNLIVGQQYQVQLFALDDESAYVGRQINWQDPADTIGDDRSVTYAMGDHAYVLATFTASNTVQSIQQNQLTANGNFDGLVLRAVGWTPPPYITANPANVGGFIGANVSLSAGAAGDTTIADPTIAYQWQAGPTNGPFTNLVEGAKYAGTTMGTLTISNLTAADEVPVYLLVAANSGGSTTSSVAHVYVQSTPVPPEPGTFGAYALSNNPVAFWHLNETNDPSSGQVRAYDFTGNGHTGMYRTGSKNAFNGIMGPTNFPDLRPTRARWKRRPGRSIRWSRFRR